MLCSLSHLCERFSFAEYECKLPEPSFSANGPEQNCAPGRIYSKEIAHRQGT